MCCVRIPDCPFALSDDAFPMYRNPSRRVEVDSPDTSERSEESIHRSGEQQSKHPDLFGKMCI